MWHMYDKNRRSLAIKCCIYDTLTPAYSIWWRTNKQEGDFCSLSTWRIHITPWKEEFRCSLVIEVLHHMYVMCTPCLLFEHVAHRRKKNAHMCVNGYLRTNVHVACACVCENPVFVCVCVWEWEWGRERKERNTCAHTYVHINISTHTCMHIHTQQTYTNICMHTYMYAYTEDDWSHLVLLRRRMPPRERYTSNY